VRKEILGTAWLQRARVTSAALVALTFGATVSMQAAPAAKTEESTNAALVKIAGEGLLESHAYEYLTQLSDDVGARVTGTPQSQKAVDWGIARMRAIGLENVHAEKFQIWRGWTRGTAQAELLEPTHRRMSVDAMGWTGSTPNGGVTGDVVMANVFNLDEEMKDPSRFSGKIVLAVVQGQPKKDEMVIFAQFGDFIKQLGQNGALAVFGGQGGYKSEGMNLTHTGILGFEEDFSLPVLSITAEDQSQMERYLASGKKIRAHVDVHNTFSNGPVETANVVGEIRGREKPEEVLVVGAHLDSWDLSEGATDNGMGSACVLAAADAILRSGQRPRRTIRFVLFNGEEQGLLGSFAYIKTHEREMPNHLGDLVLDEGQGPVKSFELGGHEDLVPEFRDFVKSLSNIRVAKVNAVVSYDTDTGPFITAGLPGINMNQDSPDYMYTHHSAADALEAVKPEILAQDATLMAVTAYWITDRQERFAKPWPAKKTATMLREQRQYDMLKAFNLWPFGDLGKEAKENQTDNNQQ
jgi:carboxypeptidase Q